MLALYFPFLIVFVHIIVHFCRLTLFATNILVYFRVNIFISEATSDYCQLTTNIIHYFATFVLGYTLIHIYNLSPQKK